MAGPAAIANLIPSDMPVEVLILAAIVGFDLIFSFYQAYSSSLCSGYAAFCGVQEGLSIVVALLALATLYFIWARQNWGLIGSIILAVLSLINFPVGTVLGLIMLYLLTRPVQRSWFTKAGTLPLFGRSAPSAPPPSMHPSQQTLTSYQGAGAAQPGPPVASPPIAAQASPRFCPKCGAPIQPASAFCAACGARVG
jgi:hypothetical protein